MFHSVEDDLYQEITKLKRFRENGITTFKGNNIVIKKKTKINVGAELYEKLLTRRRQRQQCDQKECTRRGLQSDESMLYQVLQHG